MIPKRQNIRNELTIYRFNVSQQQQLTILRETISPNPRRNSRKFSRNRISLIPSALGSARAAMHCLRSLSPIRVRARAYLYTAPILFSRTVNFPLLFEKPASLAYVPRKTARRRNRMRRLTFTRLELFARAAVLQVQLFIFLKAGASSIKGPTHAASRHVARIHYKCRAGLIYRKRRVHSYVNSYSSLESFDARVHSSVYAGINRARGTIFGVDGRAKMPIGGETFKVVSKMASGRVVLTPRFLFWL